MEHNDVPNWKMLKVYRNVLLGKPMKIFYCVDWNINLRYVILAYKKKFSLVIFSSFSLLKISSVPFYFFSSLIVFMRHTKHEWKIAVIKCGLLKEGNVADCGHYADPFTPHSHISLWFESLEQNLISSLWLKLGLIFQVLDFLNESSNVYWIFSSETLCVCW